MFFEHNLPKKKSNSLCHNCPTHLSHKCPTHLSHKCLIINAPSPYPIMFLPSHLICGNFHHHELDVPAVLVLPHSTYNYRSRNLIGHYPFWVISPRNSTSFTRPFLARRHARAGHETIVSHGNSSLEPLSHGAPPQVIIVPPLQGESGFLRENAVMLKFSVRALSYYQKCQDLTL